jgi:hypothetical protein
MHREKRNIFILLQLWMLLFGTELALGDGRERIYLVEPTGTIGDDPNLADKKFIGNPTKSYRSQHPFMVVGGLLFEKITQPNKSKP